MKEEKQLIEFITNNDVEISLVYRSNKYYILATDKKKKMIKRQVFTSLHKDLSTKEFFKVCKYFSKDLKV